MLCFIQSISLRYEKKLKKKVDVNWFDEEEGIVSKSLPSPPYKRLCDLSSIYTNVVTFPHGFVSMSLT